MKRAAVIIPVNRVDRDGLILNDNIILAGGRIGSLLDLKGLALLLHKPCC